MRWFKHYTAARYNPKLRAIEKKLGEAGYARAFKLLELIAERGGKAEDFTPKIDLKSLHTDLDWLADELRISSEDAEATLEMFASAQFINPKLWRRKIVEVPQMLEYLDEWTQRHVRPKKSGVTQEQLPSDSGKSRGRDRGRDREEVEAEPTAAATPAAAAAVSSDPKDSEEWKAINLAPMGSRPFREGWVKTHGERKPDEKLSDVMERHILWCNDSGITIPKPFYDAKRGVEKFEDGTGESNDRLPRLDVLDREPGWIGNGKLPPLEPFRRASNQAADAEDRLPRLEVHD